MVDAGHDTAQLDDGAARSSRAMNDLV